MATKKTTKKKTAEADLRILKKKTTTKKKKSTTSEKVGVSRKKVNESKDTNVASKAIFSIVIVVIIASLVVWLQGKGSTTKVAVTETTVVEKVESKKNTENKYLILDNWSSDVKKAVNDFISMYGKGSENYKEGSYAVFDFDDTCTIFNATDALMVYQLENLCFELKPEDFSVMLLTGISDINKDLKKNGYAKGITIGSFISDIFDSYKNLYTEHGPFTYKGVGKEKKLELLGSEDYHNFIAKTLMLRKLIREIEGDEKYYAWPTYFYQGMTRDQLFELSKKAFEEVKNMETDYKVFQSIKQGTMVGDVSYEYIKGLSVTNNIVEVFDAFKKSGIDVWICSNSHEDVVSAACDVFGLTPSVTGVIGIRNEIDQEGKYTNRNEELPYGAKKVEAVKLHCESQYATTPLAAFGDSTADFNMCTEFSSLKLVVVLNRADRKVTDGGGLMAIVAMYQKDDLKYDLAKANENGDTYYVLQGRNEGGFRSFRNSNKTYRFNENEEKLFANRENEIELEYFKLNKSTTKQIFDVASLRLTKGNVNNGLGFTFGFLTEYDGYHSK